MTKVAFIGAGSATFTRELLSDLFAYEDLRGLHLALHDIDPERLETGEAIPAPRPGGAGAGGGGGARARRGPRRPRHDHGASRAAGGARRRRLRGEHGAGRY